MSTNRYPLTIHAWQRIACAECGTEYLGARGTPVVAQGPQDETCNDCQIYNRAYKAGYKDGLEAGRKAVLDQVLPRLRKIAESMTTEWEEAE